MHEYELLFQNLNVGHVRFLLPDLNVIYVNNTILEMLGYDDADECISKTYAILKKEHSPDGTLLDFILDNAGIKPIEVCLRTKTDDPAWFSRVFKEEFGMSPTEAREKK